MIFLLNLHKKEDTDMQKFLIFRGYYNLTGSVVVAVNKKEALKLYNEQKGLNLKFNRKAAKDYVSVVSEKDWKNYNFQAVSYAM